MEKSLLTVPIVSAGSGDSVINVQWAKVKNALQYEVQVFQQEERFDYRQMSDWSEEEMVRRTTCITSGFSRGEKQTMLLSYHLPVVEDSYRFRVRVQTLNELHNLRVWSDFTDFSSPCYGKVQVPPRQCIFHHVSSPKPKSVELRWSDSPYDHIVEYEVSIQSVPSVKWNRAVSTHTSRHTFNTLTTGVEYRFKVRARNLIGWGRYSEPSEAVMCTPGPPSAPNPPLAREVPGNDHTDPSVLITWSFPNGFPPGITNYCIEMEYRDNSSNNNDAWTPLRHNSVVDLKPSHQSYSIPRIKLGCWYRARVTATSVYGKSDWSDWSNIVRTLEQHVDTQELVWNATHEGIQATLDLLDKYPYTAEIASGAASAIWKRFRTLPEENCVHDQDPEDITWHSRVSIELLLDFCQVVVVSVDRFASDRNVAKWSIRCLGVLLVTCLESHECASKTNVVTEKAVEGIKASITRFPSVSSVVQWGCEALVRIAAAGGNDVQVKITSRGGTALLLECLGNNDGSVAVYFFACQVLTLCMFTNVLCRYEAKMAGLVECCNAALRTFEEDTVLVDVITSALTLVDGVSKDSHRLHYVKYEDGRAAWNLLGRRVENATRAQVAAARTIQRWHRSREIRYALVHLMESIRRQIALEEGLRP